MRRDARDCVPSRMPLPPRLWRTSDPRTWPPGFMPALNPPRYVSVHEAAVLLATSPLKIHAWINDGLLVASKRRGRDVVVLEESVKRLAKIRQDVRGR